MPDCIPCTPCWRSLAMAYRHRTMNARLTLFNLALFLVIVVCKIIINYTVLKACNGSWCGNPKQFLFLWCEVYMECTLDRMPF